MYDKASIALIPSGYKSGVVDNLYSVLPSNGNGDFNHSRSSIATRVNKDGLIESVAADVPRLDYTGNVDCPHLLLEPQRRNLFTDSDLSGISPITSGDGGVADTMLSNGLSGKKIDITSSGRVFYQLFATCVIGTQYTVSCYVYNFVGEAESNFIDITVGGNSEDFSSSLITNGRMQGTFTATATSVQIRIGIGTTSNRTGTKSAKISGIQLEDGGSGVDATFATSLIHTTGIIETRSADICNSSGTSAEFNDSEGVLFAEIAALANDGTNRRIAIPNTGFTALHRLEYFSTDNSINAVTYIAPSPSNEVVLSHTLPDSTKFVKVAYKYKTGDFALWVNGVEVGTSVSGNLPTGLTKLNFDNGSGSNDFYGKCKQLIYFNEALSDSELQTLTS